MKTVKIILNKIADHLASDNPDYEFATWLEFFLCDNYKLIESENAEIARIMNDDLTELCEITEPGSEFPEFRARLKKEYKRLITLV